MVGATLRCLQCWVALVYVRIASTIARLLRGQGYSTGIGGKWQINHLGAQTGILDQYG